MNGQDYFGFSVSHGNHKKRAKITLRINLFFRSVTYVVTLSDTCIRSAVAGPCAARDGGFKGNSPAAVFLLLSPSMLCDPPSLHCFVSPPTCTAGHRFSPNPGIKDFPMTITNHMRIIEQLTCVVIEHVDDRDYGHAHIALDSIEFRVRLAREHVDNLQRVTTDKPAPLKG